MRIALPVAVVLSLVPAAVGAQTTQAFPVSAVVLAGCIVATDGGGRWGRIDFGTVSGVAQGPVDANLVSTGGAGIAFECTPGVTATMTADTGTHALAGARRLASGNAAATPIAYSLFVDGNTTAWSTQPIVLAFTSVTGRRIVPIRGRALLAAPMAAGLYTDTVRITIAW